MRVRKAVPTRWRPAYIIFGQGPQQSPSVFNFFSPFYAPPGEIRNSGLVAPELQIATEYQNTFITNYFFLLTFQWNSAAENPGEDDVLIDISEEIAMAADTDAVIDLVVDKLLGGEVSAPLRAEMQNMIDRVRTAFPGNDAAIAAGSDLLRGNVPRICGTSARSHDEQD